MKKKLQYNLNSVSTLRIKLITVFSVLFTVAFTVISLTSYQVSKSIVTKDIDLQTREVALGHAAEIDQWIARMFSIVNTYRHIIETSIPSDRGITPAILGHYRNETFFSDLYYGSVSGRFTSGRNWTPPSGYDPRVRSWYVSAARNRKTVMSEVYLDYETGTLAVSVSSPVYSSKGSLRGVISADLLLKTLNDKLENIKVNGMGYAVLIDKSGVVLAHPDKTLIGKNLNNLANLKSIVKTVFERKQGRIDYNFEDDSLAVFTPVQSSGWILGIVLAKEEVYSNLKQIALKFSVIFIVSIVIVILTSVYFAGKLTYFMELLEQTVETRTAELKEKIAEVEYLSLTDPLTGMSNRRKIEADLKSEIKRSARTGNDVAVIMIDIDHFKQFNDNHGHETGDKILKEFAATVNGSIRTIDKAGRLGGEEFLIVCPETSVTGAFLVAEKLRAAVESMKVDKVDRVTASFGCASLRTGENSDRIISRADKALYLAKELGRNRVEIDF